MAYTESKSESYFWRKRERERQKDWSILDGAAAARLVDSKLCTGKLLGPLLQNRSCNQGLEKRLQMGGYENLYEWVATRICNDSHVRV